MGSLSKQKWMLLEQKQTPNASRCDLQKNEKITV